MRKLLLAILSALSMVSLSGCDENGPVTVIFTGDCRGYLVPAG